MANKATDVKNNKDKSYTQLTMSKAKDTFVSQVCVSLCRSWSVCSRFNGKFARGKYEKAYREKERERQWEIERDREIEWVKCPKRQSIINWQSYVSVYLYLYLYLQLCVWVT